eukprot:347373-Chlamydomonas_euryale.AAC.1
MRHGDDDARRCSDGGAGDTCSSISGGEGGDCGGSGALDAARLKQAAVAGAQPAAPCMRRLGCFGIDSRRSIDSGRARGTARGAPGRRLPAELPATTAFLLLCAAVCGSGCGRGGGAAAAIGTGGLAAAQRERMPEVGGQPAYAGAGMDAGAAAEAGADAPRVLRLPKSVAGEAAAEATESAFQAADASTRAGAAPASVPIMLRLPKSDAGAAAAATADAAASEAADTGGGAGEPAPRLLHASSDLGTVFCRLPLPVNAFPELAGRTNASVVPALVVLRYTYISADARAEVRGFAAADMPATRDELAGRPRGPPYDPPHAKLSLTLRLSSAPGTLPAPRSWRVAHATLPVPLGPQRRSQPGAISATLRNLPPSFRHEYVLEAMAGGGGGAAAARSDEPVARCELRPAAAAHMLDARGISVEQDPDAGGSDSSAGGAVDGVGGVDKHGGVDSVGGVDKHGPSVDQDPHASDADAGAGVERAGGMQPHRRAVVVMKPPYNLHPDLIACH